MDNQHDGYLYKNDGMTPNGICPECAANHNPEEPHNRASLTYQFNFLMEHGRIPTWADTMAHCSEDIKELWTKALRERGVEI